MNTRTFHAHARTYRVDMVVIALYGNLCPFAWNTGHCAYIDKSVVYFRHLQLKQTAEEFFACPGNRDTYVVVFIFNLLYNGTDIFALAEKVAWNSLAFRKNHFIVLAVEQKCFLAPCLINLAKNKFSFTSFELGIYCLFLKVENFRLQCLAQRKYCAAAKIGKYYLARMLVANLNVRVLVGTRIRQGNLRIRIRNLAIGHNFKILKNLNIALVWIKNHVKVFISTEHFS